MTPPFRIGNLGELAIRCRDYAPMQGYLGHTQVLALFAPNAEVPQRGEGSSLHHLALGIAAKVQDSARNWLISKGFEADCQEFTWIGWRGLFTADPDGNTLELVAYAGKSAP